MKQHRKWLALALAGALSLSLLAGCAGNEAPDTSANSTAPAETEGTVQETPARCGSPSRASSPPAAP